MVKIAKLFSSFRHNTSGQFAVWTGILALPILAISTAGIDIARADSLKNGLQNALDSAALAAVTEQRLTTSQRADYARDYFNENFKNSDSFTLTPVSTTAERVELLAEGTSPISISAVFGKKDIKVSATSASEVTKGSTICVMTINPDGRDSFTVSDGADFDASSCAVQVNSDHKTAAVVESGATASAERFCVRGGAKGQFLPYVNTECSLIEDPYAGKSGPDLDDCVSTKKKDLVGGGDTEIGDDIVLQPGTYCKNLKVKGKNVTFEPGTYIMDNAQLTFMKGAQAVAEDVTFVLRGSNATILVTKGSSLYLKAPKTGELAGLAIFQDVGAGLGKGVLPNGKTELRGESSMTIVGTVYVPEQEIFVSSDSGFGAKSPATSFIGYNVAFSGRSKISVSVDHETAGLPPILPKADESARLVR